MTIADFYPNLRDDGVVISLMVNDCYGLGLLVAYALGFSDPSNFARAFKRWAGETPRQYRSR